MGMEKRIDILSSKNSLETPSQSHSDTNLTEQHKINCKKNKKQRNDNTTNITVKKSIKDK